MNRPPPAHVNAWTQYRAMIAFESTRSRFLASHRHANLRRKTQAMVWGVKYKTTVVGRYTRVWCGEQPWPTPIQNG